MCWGVEEFSRCCAVNVWLAVGEVMDCCHLAGAKAGSKPCQSGLLG